MRKCVDNVYNRYAKFIRVKCRCGHSMWFLRNHSSICNVCGSLVYPSEKAEFVEKTTKALNKIKFEGEI